jgi:hypothetical protein
MLMAKTKQVQKLQIFNLRMGLLHLAQAVVLAFIANLSLKIPIITRFFDSTPEGIRPVATTLVDIPVAIVGPVFLLIAALFHLFIASPLYVRRYEANLKKGINPLRWWEYSISSSIMLTVLLMMGGLIELPSVVFVFTLNFIMNMMGLMMERYNQLTDKTKWLPYNIGVVAGIVPWIIGGLYFWVSTSNIADSIPGYAKAGFLLTFLFFNSFAINMVLQYAKVGKWKDYLYGERMYIILSLVAKSVLAWIVVLGTLGGSQ